MPLRRKNSFDCIDGPMQSIEKLEVRRLLGLELTQDGAAPLPEIVIAAPFQHGALQRNGIVAENCPETLRGDWIDIIPPGARDDHLFVHAERVHTLKWACCAHPCQLDRGVALLAKFCASPHSEDIVAPCLGAWNAALGKESFAHLTQRNGRYAQVRHGRFHVSLHRGRPGRFRHGCQPRPQN